MTSVRGHHDAVLAALDAGTSHPVGDAEAPAGDAPYLIVYPGGSGGLMGTLDAPHADAEPLTQVTCVGESRQQAQWIADEARAVLLGQPAIPGRRVLYVELETSLPIRRDDDATPPVFYAVDLYRIATTPA